MRISDSLNPITGLLLFGLPLVGLTNPQECPLSPLPVSPCSSASGALQGAKSLSRSLVASAIDGRLRSRLNHLGGYSVGAEPFFPGFSGGGWGEKG